MEMSLQQQVAVKKANEILGILRKEIKEKMEGIAMALWVTCLHLENCVQFWSPYSNSGKATGKIHH